MKKRKAGGRPPSPEVAAIIADIDEYLFGGSGKVASDYFLERVSGSSFLVGFRAHGQDYDLVIDDEHLADAALRRLLELNVEVRDR